MDNNPGIEAMRKLAHLGYRFTLNGVNIKVKYHGPDKPDPDMDTVRALWETVKAHRGEVIYFLKSYCPRCSGCCFVPDSDGRPLCLACDWEALVELYPNLKVKIRQVQDQTSTCRHSISAPRDIFPPKHPKPGARAH